MGKICIDCGRDWQEGRKSCPFCKGIRRGSTQILSSISAPAEYIKEVVRTLSPYDIRELTDNETQIMHGLLGIASEAGELSDIAKKFLFHGDTEPLDWMKVLDEIGDVLWYIAVVLAAMGMPFETVMALNIDKLQARYPDGYDVKQSLHHKE